MTTKVLVSLGSTLSALLAMGGGVEAYQRSQREREEATRATVVAMEHFEQTIGRARSSIQQSSELRTELIQKTDLLLKDVANTEQELVQHGAQVVALNFVEYALALVAGQPALRGVVVNLVAGGLLVLALGAARDYHRMKAAAPV